ncbi:hypothetical protein N825_08775 [Skermanella stibiiresistens SB22]|uniref:Amidase domain-containing protein n=1 Tax=Skermanella stibiiresistens SB22 TaxID=1385369 RepID=W9H2Y9_9PROT|nr:amidase [Skermanella stibiiresistens]EWY39087.1 hypothetical protein N825_08775 [Skermanella stibiiresistens SB22]
MTGDAPLWSLGIRDLTEGYGAGAFSPADAIASIQERIAEVNPALNALVTPAPTDRIAAEAADSAGRWRAGRALGPLDGVPFTVKDNILAEGITATWGSKLFRDFVPETDELPVARVRAAGAIVLGKTNVPEFTLEGYTSNLLFGTTRNPWNSELTPGGSSGGAVAAVVSGFGPFALGTDGGGSIRRPVAHTGLVGLKPSIGKVARHSGFPPVLFDFEVIGPIARTVEDAALVFDVIAGPDALDRASLAPDLAAVPGPKRILYVPRFGDAPVDPEISRSVAAAADVLRGLGHEMTEGAVPFDIGTFNAAWPIVGAVGLAALFDLHPGHEALVNPKYLEMAERGRAVSAPEYFEVIEAIHALRRAMVGVFRSTDLILTPSIAALSWPAAEAFPPLIDGREAGPRGHAIFTGWVNMAGLPAIGLPCAPSSSGLPIGFQLVGPFGADRTLLEVAGGYDGRVNAG